MTKWAGQALALVLLAGAAFAQSEPAAIPEPPLDGLEVAVQERLRAARNALVAAVEAGQLEPSELAQLYGNTGMVFHAHHSFEVAEVCYQRASALNPEELRWPYFLGYLYQDLGRFEESAEAYEMVLKIVPRDQLARLRLGEVLLSLNLLVEAEEHLRAVREVEGLEAVALAGLGKIAMGKGELEVAVDLYRQAISLQPSASQLYYPLALALRKLGRTEEAKAAITEGGNSKVEAKDLRLAEVGSLTVSSEMFMTSGARAIKGGQLEQAAIAFRGAIAARPDNARAHLNLAVVLRQLDQLEAAEQSARRALEIQPDYFFGHFNLGEILEAQGKAQAAIEEYQAALAIDPGHIKANEKVAAALLRRGEFATAAEHYAAVIEAAPALIAPRYLRTLALVGDGRVVDARREAEVALTVHADEPKLQEAWVRLVAIDAGASSEELERALLLALEGQRARPTFAGAETLALILAAAGRFEDATALQLRLVEQLPPDAPATDRRHLEENLGRFRAGQRPVRAWP